MDRLAIVGMHELIQSPDVRVVEMMMIARCRCPAGGLGICLRGGRHSGCWVAWNLAAWDSWLWGYLRYFAYQDRPKAGQRLEKTWKRMHQDQVRAIAVEFLYHEEGGLGA